MERYEEASSNQYSEEVRILLRVKEARDGKTLAYNTHTAAFKPPVEVSDCFLFESHFLVLVCFLQFCMIHLLSPSLIESHTEKQMHSEGRAGLGC